MTLSMATEDLYDATAYICRHMPDVDPSRIVTCGSSAGAITVLMGEYWLCNGHPLTAGKFTQDFSYAGVIAFAGSRFAIHKDSLRWARDPAPMLLFHGDADRNVPYGAIGVDGVQLFGSKSIADDLARRRVPHAFYSVAETNHSMAWRPMTENRGDRLVSRKSWFKRQRLATDVRITPLDPPAVPKDFGISDYIDANYGH